MMLKDDENKTYAVYDKSKKMFITMFSKAFIIPDEIVSEQGSYFNTVTETGTLNKIFVL